MRAVLCLVLLPAVAAAQIASGTGHWEAASVGFAPWTFDLQIEGNTVTGTIGQGADDPPTGMTTTLVGPFPISDGKVNGNQIEFRAVNAGRTVTFQGTIVGDEIHFRRSINSTAGYNGIFGGAGATEFTARKAKAAPAALIVEVRGMKVDVSQVQSAKNLKQMLASLTRQIEIVDLAVPDPAKNAFLKSIPIAWAPAPDPDSDNATYARVAGVGKGRVTLTSQIYDPEKPVLLHELLHAYHDQQLPAGFANADIRRLFEQARSTSRFPAGAYMLSNSSEYFAVMASVYLHGSVARDPFTRAAVKEKQPDFYAWMQQEFGPK